MPGRPAEIRSSYPPTTVLVSTIDRNPGCEIRVYLVRLVGRDARVSVGLWFRNAFKSGDEWHSERVAGGAFSTRLRASEVPLVAAAMHKAVDMARERGWELR